MHDVTLTESQPMRIDVGEVIKVLRRIKPNKAAGPDGLKGIVLKECAGQLGHVCTRLFQVFLDDGFVPVAWKNTTVIPVPKTSYARAPKDLRPIALTYVLCKCMEHILCKELLVQINGSEDPLQFDNMPNRSTVDASLPLLHKAQHHLDKTNAHVRMFFMDFTSAFNTVQPQILKERLRELGVRSWLILWILIFLSNRPQRVC